MNGTFAQRLCSSHLKTLRLGRFPFKRWCNSHRETLCKKLLPLAQSVFLHKMSVFLHFIWRGLFSKSEWFSNFKKLSDHKYSFHKLTQFSHGNNVLDFLLLTYMVFLQEIQCFFHSLERRYWTQRLCSSPLKPWEVGNIPFERELNSQWETMC
jgi:hypothetical protein